MVAGSLRRMRETIADVDILASSDHPEKVMEAFVNLPQADKVVAKHGKRDVHKYITNFRTRC